MPYRADPSAQKRRRMRILCVRMHDPHRSFLTSLRSDAHGERAFRQLVREQIGPLDQARARRALICAFEKARVLQLRCVFQAIQIEMMERATLALIGQNDVERGAHHVFSHAHARRHPLSETGLPRTQAADEGNGVAICQT